MKKRQFILRLGKRFLFVAGAGIGLVVVGYAGLLTQTYFESGPAIPEPGRSGQSFSRLESARPREIIHPADDPGIATEQLSELVQRARAEGRKIAIAGSQHSMGGHTLVDAGWLIDMRCPAFRQIEAVQRRGDHATVRVGSGVTWHELLLVLDREGWSVDVMQSNDDFTVGGSVSVNCHGWNPVSESIAATVEAFTIIHPDGTVSDCRRDRAEDRALFGAVSGGYGLLGVITAVELRVVPNAFYRAEEFSASAASYAERFASLVPETDSSIGLAYGRISVAPGPWFLDDARVIRFVRIGNPEISPANTVRENGGDFGITATEIGLARTVFGASVGNRLGKLGRWAIEKVHGQTHRAVSRNSILRTPSTWFANRDPAAVEIFHEYFLPTERLAEFLAQVHPILRRADGVDLLNVTVRKVKQDQLTTLCYARTDVFGLVMLFHYPATLAADNLMSVKTRKLIDAALACGGTYYLPYRHHATVDQFRRAYPDWASFLEVKNKYDPTGVFENVFYSTYLAPAP